MAAGRARGSRPRRVSLPGVAELLRPVGPGPASDSGRQASGREAHPQKITVYLSADELLDLERARLTLLAHGIGVDRGRLVREAIAVLLMDLEAGIDASVVHVPVAVEKVVGHFILVVHERWKLRFGNRKRHGELSRRVHVTEEDVGDGVASF